MQISLDSKRLDIAFGVSLILMLTLPSLVPQLRLSFFAPVLIMACYQKSLRSCICLAFLCGILLDLLSAHPHFGLYALNYSLTILMLYPQRRNFFADNLSTLPIMTYFFAILSTLVMAVLLYSLEMKNIMSAKFLLTDLVLMPAADACYAFLCFILPGLITGKPRRRGKDYFN